MRGSFNKSGLRPHLISRLLLTFDLSDSVNPISIWIRSLHRGIEAAFQPGTMSDAGTNLAKSRAIITSACNVLLHGPRLTLTVGRGAYAFSADSYVLLCDATKLFCQSVSELYGEREGKRWSPVLPELLLSHPERCRETLQLVEMRDFKELSFLQFAAA